MYDSILVPTDGGEHANRAAAHAASLAHAMEAAVHVIAVVDVQSAAGPFSAGGVDEAFVEQLESEATDALETVERRLDEAGVATVETVLTEGTPRKAILEYAAEAGVDAIAMGTHGRSGLGRFVTGSVTEHVLRRADVPVLTVRAPEESHPAGPYEDVLVPTDGSECAAAAIDHGIGVARAFDARVHAVSVIDPTVLAASPDTGPTPGMLERFEAAHAEATETVAERAREAGLTATTAVQQGSPARTLLEYADEQGVDLLAMGTHGRTGPRRLVLGSVTERVIRHADVPVLAVRSGRASD